MRSTLRRLFFGFTLMELYLIGRAANSSKSLFSRLLVRWCKHKINRNYACYISFEAEIDSTCKFVHPTGVVIGRGVKIASKCSIYQGVTIGAAQKGEGVARRYPVILSGAILFAGAKVIGPVLIGENSVIGANAVVVSDSPSGSTMVGIPAKVKYDGKS